MCNRGTKEILKNRNYSTFAANENDAMLRAKEMALFINQFILKPSVANLLKQIPLHIISIDDDFHFWVSNRIQRPRIIQIMKSRFYDWVDRV